MRIVVGISGSSGVIYGVRLLRALPHDKVLMVSPTAERILQLEAGVKMAELKALADETYDDSDLFSPTASGSNLFDAMVICPCSESTLAKIACGIADTLITRTAAVAMKEGRKLILVPRETPVSAIMLENELRLARLGVTILPASPGFYPKPKSIEDMVDFVVGKVLDQLRIQNDLYRRWE
ncbi:MAG TPA: UbiX family flavin prenyltransferase [Methanomassiliicoccales archaeon]|nr:UbiX family flavin prenyltransferase [Methanomassiliicoccales archaeon]